jgi:hypothetical protein
MTLAVLMGVHALGVLILFEVVDGCVFFLDFFFVPLSRPAWSP